MRDNAWVALAVVAVIIAFALSSSNGTAGNAFTTMAVPNGTNPVASSASDTLTFAEGSNITITGDAGSDTITIAATGAGSGDISAVGDCDTGDCFVLGGMGSELTFDPSNTVTYEEGRIYYDSDVNAFTAFNNEPDVALNIGEETWTFVRNNTGSTITNGQAVYVSGAIGNIPTIALAQADATATSNVIAVATHDIENNTTGYVTAFGAIRDLDTSSFVAGDTLFLSATVAGGLSTVRPTSPNFDVFVGTVTVAHPSVGIIYVDIRGRNSRIDCNGPNDALTFTLATDVFGCNTISAGSTGIDVELNGTTAVTGAEVMDFLSPFNVTDDAGDAQISLPLADDNIFVGNGSSVPIATPVSDCDLQPQALTYDTTGNAVGCHAIPTSHIMANAGGTFVWSIPGYSCNNTATNASAYQNDILYGLIVPPQTTTYIAIGMSVNSAGAGGTVARIGIYEADQAASGYTPGALIVDAGTVAIDSTGNKSIAISETLTQGQPYFLAIVHDAAAVTLVSCSTNQMQISTITGRATNQTAALDENTLTALNVGTGAFSDPAATPDFLSGVETSTFVRLSE